MNNNERDKYICQEYKEGGSIGELARTYGLTEERIGQILRENGVPRRPRGVKEKRPLSALHSRIGLHLYNYRFDRGIELYPAAKDLGWSALKLRKVEKGVKEVELLDLLDIAAYTGTKVGELLEKTNG
ncbi:hypothetical protein MHM88_14140 [Epibacterium sp. MM17-32]|uniref:hypothetical protein n=1 Tax=Epibacterium sp. MM17-32 TaxID=2917734 RepID=UPI001EF59AF0|nr:hypothetical protein [Epibacterium sp. MM17-32]MCG7628947.1 hypothetical protein [Epibacterium sp. MM17-32]